MEPLKDEEKVTEKEVLDYLKELNRREDRSAIRKTIIGLLQLVAIFATGMLVGKHF
jgi:hypothetical protein